MTDARYQMLKRDYEAIREDNPDRDLAPYDSLTEDQRAFHERSFKRLRLYMDTLGRAISEGTELPNPLAGE